MTFSDLAKIITYSYDPKHNVMKLTRSINIQAWLQGKPRQPKLQRHWSDITKAQHCLIEACARLDDGTEVPARVTIKASESSKSPWVQGWFRYVISLLKDLCTTLLDQSFHGGKEMTRNTIRRTAELQTRRRLKSLKIPRK
jgi:hypothetical protein